ncbi:hypothetical protein HA402_008580 [Bradysia odoriphaga]|nr:hypothetical protein HA402_008580 [Bradysia odoriphaga]
MSGENSKMEHDHQCASKVHGSSLRSKPSTEEERRRKLVKFNAVAEVKEISEDSGHSKLDAVAVDQMQAAPSTNRSVSSSTLVNDKEPKRSFHSKRRNHYKNEFTNSRTSKHSDQSD